VLAGAACTNTLNTLKKGPADIQSIVSSGQQYTDYDFNPSDQGVSYLRWGDVAETRNNQLFDDGTLHFSEVNQGGYGNCYFISQIATVAEWPSYITEMFVTGTDENDAGIYGVKFYIRGKPWVVSLDNKLGFSTRYG